MGATKIESRKPTFNASSTDADRVSKITTQRQEEDRCEILSGVFEGKTLGTPGWQFLFAIKTRGRDSPGRKNFGRRTLTSPTKRNTDSELAGRGTRFRARDARARSRGCCRAKSFALILSEDRHRRLRDAGPRARREDRSIESEDERR